MLKMAQISVTISWMSTPWKGCGWYTVRKRAEGAYVAWSHTMESSIEIQKELWRKEVRPDFTEFVSVLTHEPIGVYLFV